MKKKRNLSEIPKLSGGSLDIKAGQVEKLKSLFPQTVKDGKVDFDALKQALGGEIAANGERYGLSWAGKADCFRHIQQTTTATLKPDRKESVDFDNTENIFIEGDNYSYRPYSTLSSITNVSMPYSLHSFLISLLILCATK